MSGLFPSVRQVLPVAIFPSTLPMTPRAPKFTLAFSRPQRTSLRLYMVEGTTGIMFCYQTAEGEWGGGGGGGWVHKRCLTVLYR